MKMLMFDFRETEKEFFEKNKLNDFEITFFNEPLNDETVLTDKQLEETDVISVFTASNLTEPILNKFQNLRVVATRSTGFDHIDVSYCMKKNIAVLNIEQYGKTAVAQYAIGLIICLVRHMLPAAMDFKNRKVDNSAYEGRTLNSMTIGIIGAGAIGGAVAKIAHFFGMNVLVHSYMKNQEIDNFCDYVELDKLLKEADIITLHIPYTGDNYHMIGEEQFNMMKNGVYIINTARGELIDIKALYDNLIRGKVAGAGLDVLECEFLCIHPGELKDAIKDSKPNCVESALITQKLFNMPNVVITPNIAYNTNETVNYLLEETFNNIRDYMKGMNTNRVC